MTNEYKEVAHQLIMAVDIAIESYKAHPPKGLTSEHLELMITFFEETKEQALNPEKEFQKVSSLEFLTYDFLREFQEGSGSLVDFFWERISQEGLPYQKENRMIQILRGKKIKSFSEYSYVTQNLNLSLEDNQITFEEGEQLVALVKAYEKFNQQES